MKKYIKSSDGDKEFLQDIAYLFFDEGYRPEDIYEYLKGNPDYDYHNRYGFIYSEFDVLDNLSEDDIEYVIDCLNTMLQKNPEEYIPEMV